MAQEVGNIHIGLYVDVGESRRFTDVANVVEKSSRRMNTALGHTSSSVHALRGHLSRGLQFRFAQNSLRDLSRATDATTQLRAAIVGLSAVTTGSLTGAFSAAFLVQTADKARLLSNQIKTVTDSTSEFAAIQESLFQVSQKTRSSYEATTTLYARMARATEHFGFSQEKLLRTTETIQKAFQIGGASSQEAQGAAIQLSQGIASDRFSGEEFRSVAENAPVLLKGIAESLDVNIGKLREMAHAGELTAQVVTEAILKSSDDIDASFSKIIPTMAQSWTLLNNAIIRYTGETDEAYGATEKIASAIAGLAANLEDVMYWVTRVTGGIAAIYAANKITKFAQGTVGSIRENNAAARDQVDNINDRNKQIGGRLSEIDSEIAEARKTVTAAEDAAIAKNSTAVNAAKSKEYDAVQNLKNLERQRLILAGKLNDANSAHLVKLQAESELARQRVRDDQLRVIQAQEAVTAEEGIIRARNAQKLQRADQNVAKAGVNLNTAKSRVDEAKAAVEMEKKLAKTRLENEVEARRQALVTSTQRLTAVKSEIKEIRSVVDLPDFEKVYGRQYAGLLKQQQTAISSTQKLRNEISSLEKKIMDVDAGARSTSSISSAMSKQEKAVKAVERAVENLSKAEASRQAVIDKPVEGRSLEGKIARQTKEVERYQRSVTNLQSKMVALRAATESAFSGRVAKRFIADIDALDKKIAAANVSLQNAAQSVSNARSGDAKLLAASLSAQEKAAQKVNALQREAKTLLDAQIINTERLAVAQTRLNVLRRAGAGFLGALGGPWGLGITVALVSATALMSRFAANAAESAQETEKITKLLRDMGYLTEEAASAMDDFSESVAGRRISKLQVELDNFQQDVEKTIETLNDIDTSGEAGSALIKPFVAPDNVSQFEQEKAFQKWLKASREAAFAVGDEIGSIRDEMVKNKGMTDEMRKSLEDIALANPEIASTTLQLISLGERLNAISKAVEDWSDNIRKVREEANKLPQDRFWNSRTKAAETQSKIAAARDVVVTTLFDEANMTEAEKRINAIMDKIVKDMDKAGQVLNSAAVRSQAEQIYAAETTNKAIGGFVDRAIKAESGGNAKARPLNADGSRRSSAFGIGQFIESTWLDLFKKHFPTEAASMTKQQILQLRSNTEKSRALIEAYAKENAAILQKAGISVDEVALQLAHFLGPQGAASVLKAAPGTPVASILGQKAVRANPAVLGGGATVDDVIAYGQKRAGITTTGTQRLDSREALNNALGQQQKMLDALKLETGIRQTLNPLVNDYGRSLSTLETAQKLFNVAQEEGTAAGKELESVQQLLKGDFSELTPEARAQAEAMLTLARSTGEYTAASKIAEESQERLKKSFTESAAFGKNVFSGIISDLRRGASAGEILANVFDKILDRMIEMSLTQLFDGPIGGSGGGPLGMLSNVLFGALFPFDEGGYTGHGGKKQAAGVVHAGEFVFDAESTKEAGVENLYRMMEMLKGNKLMTMPGYEMGGFVGRMKMPSFDTGGYANNNSSVSGLNDNLRSSKPAEMVVHFVPHVDESGSLTALVTKVSKEEVGKAAPAIVNASRQQVVPAMAEYQNDKAGGDWRG